ncbi:12162_t:CDS:1, partial [Cetraspora pellucida]
NCSSHKLDFLNLQYVDVHFLPANTTSKIQPMDAGIIMSFKRHYRRHHIAWMLQQIETEYRAEDLKMDVLQAIRYTIQAWKEVTNDTIRNCWRHTNILPKSFNADLRNLSENVNQNVESEINDLITMIENLNFSDPMQVEEFLNIPDENLAYEIPDDELAIAEL